MKPILDWYEELPEPYRSQAIDNYDEEFSIASEKSVPLSFTGLERALRCGFNWDKSPQKYRHWHSVVKMISSGEFDKQK